MAMLKNIIRSKVNAHSQNLRPLQNALFRSLRSSAQSQRCIRILILGIFNIFLWLNFPYAPPGPSSLWSGGLILNEIEHFSKVSKHITRFLNSHRLKKRCYSVSDILSRAILPKNGQYLPIYLDIS